MYQFQMKSRLVYLISALLLPYCAVTSQSVSLHFNLETNQSIVLNTKELGKPNWVTYRFESGLTVAISEKTPCVISVNNPYYLPYVDTIFDAGVYYINLIRNDIELPSIVITGELEKSTTDSAIFDIQVINQKGFNKTASNTVKDALQFNSAINTFDDNAIGNSIEINGLSANNIKVLRDGVPLTGRVFRNIDLSQLNLNNVERIEIVEGPQVVAYGADALAGTINIISKIDAPSQVYGSIYSESVGVINTAIGGVASAGNTSISLDAARHYFDGIDFNDSTRSLDWNRKEQYFISPSL
ncbi:MAG: outer membrane receptor for ferrienterochelin and colicins, partial [Sphingobacteriales bacterium]